MTRVIERLVTLTLSIDQGRAFTSSIQQSLVAGRFIERTMQMTRFIDPDAVPPDFASEAEIVTRGFAGRENLLTEGYGGGPE
jgi:hypothetical protein